MSWLLWQSCIVQPFLILSQEMKLGLRTGQFLKYLISTWIFFKWANPDLFFIYFRLLYSYFNFTIIKHLWSVGFEFGLSELKARMLTTRPLPPPNKP